MRNFNEFLICPVAREQRPFFEYLKSRKSNFIGWVSLNEFGYTKKFFGALFFNSILSFSSLSYFVYFLDYPIRLLVTTVLFSLILQALLYCYLFINWNYVGSRLVNKKILYEESGWSNQKIWIKPEFIFKQDILLYNYQLIPLLNRIKSTLYLIKIVFIIFLGFRFVLLY